MDEQMYKDSEKAFDDLIESCGIPKGHPLNNGEKSHHSIGFLALMILNIYLEHSRTTKSDKEVAFLTSQEQKFKNVFLVDFSRFQKYPLYLLPADRNRHYESAGNKYLFF